METAYLQSPALRAEVSAGNAAYLRGASGPGASNPHPRRIKRAPYSDHRQGLPRELTIPQTEVLPELCPQLQGCGGRREEAWPSSSPNELPRAVVLTFSLGIRAPNKFELHFRGPQKTETSLRTRQRQSGNRRGVVVGKVPAVPGGLGWRPGGGQRRHVNHLRALLLLLSRHTPSGSSLCLVLQTKFK